MTRGTPRQTFPGSRLTDLVGTAAEKSFAKFGFAGHAVASHWCSIVGPALARLCAPVRLRFPAAARHGGTLTILVDGPAAVELQHRTPEILERLNLFFGYPAIAGLKFQQGVLPPRPPAPRPPRPLDPARAAALETLVDGVLDEPLRASLRRLGQAVLGETPDNRASPPRESR